MKDYALKYASKSFEWIERKYMEVAAQMDGIRAQLEQAKVRAVENSGYTLAQAEWRARAKIALHAYGREHQQLQRELSRRKWQRIRNDESSFESRFLEAAKRKLDRDLFLDLVAEANAELDKAVA